MSRFYILIVILCWTRAHSFIFKLSQLKLRSTVRFLNEESRLKTTIIDGKRQLDSWFDECVVFVKGGSGGHGSKSYHYRGGQRVRPCGGDGGNGGNVVFIPESNKNTLKWFKFNSKFFAESGQPGNSSFNNGADARDLIVRLPLGSIIKVNDTGEVIGELTSMDHKVIAAKGGLGGLGNAGINKKDGLVKCKSPTAGDKRYVKIELKLVADIGLLGVPNAGKSTLLSVMTRANPKIASYPFTTLVPNLGVCYDDTGEAFERSMVIADIPGLVEGASEGKGLGKAFLRHIERCKILIHLINGMSSHPVEDYLAINQELKLFSPILAKKPQIVVLNKIDLPEVQDKRDTILAQLQANMNHSRLLVISANSRIGVEDLIVRTRRFLDKLETETP